MSGLEHVQDKVVTAISTLLPALKTCDAHPGRFTPDELKAFIIKAPSAHVAMPTVKGGVVQGGLAMLDVKIVTVFTARNTVLDAKKLLGSQAALAMVSAFMTILPGLRLGSGIGQASDIQADNLYDSSVRKDGVALWAVHWSTTVTVQPEIDEQLGTLSQLLYSWAPEIGVPHKNDYLPLIGGAS
ncbi:hypothetical protein ACFFUB_00465 [Algimonas porphyrae]|uniref:Uncharacterized protein n=1 Tax=Algimonas porphyrae TaxID=1128113 RepID=A0ABQ5UZF7_9PROT|nr:hypothetical protein [Algimonas porphyrae]GLQ20503.1 hypothetical protein GCM10007854_14580 [Algimonas porphyrae]